MIGVILMVPCYAVESVSNLKLRMVENDSSFPFKFNILFCQQFVSLVNPDISVDIGIMRDCYESFAMYCFGRYLVACLGNLSYTSLCYLLASHYFGFVSIS